ncbi:TolC family protein [Undibacterium sp. FT31W]|uniref:TolC family protein n=1 Tax=Undibacterium griseum TaxID=2762295 RepID=A0ABR6YJN6_9BURK|nr:TolC family protein [Undibacterium griseum]MBC3884102.1 TolC family protein [Undibacterium griseum]
MSLAFFRDARPLLGSLRPLVPAACSVLAVATVIFVSLSNVQAASFAAAPQALTPNVIEPAAPLTLTAALRLALQANPDLSAARQETAAAEGQVMQAGASPNPDLSLQVEDLRKDTRTTTLLVNQALELGGKRNARITAAERGRDAAQADLAAKRAEIRAAVISAFFDVAAAQERLRLSQVSLELAQHATTAAAHRVAAGKISPVDETKARVAEATVRLELNQANGELTTARKRLTALWGNPSPRFDRAESQFEALPILPALTELQARAGQAPALMRAQIEVERRIALVQVEQSKRTPDLTLSVGVKRAEDLGRNQAVLGVSVPLPLFDRNQGNLFEALRRTDKARDELSASRLRVDTDTAQAYERYANARQEAEALRQEILPGAQTAYDAATKGFKFGKFGFLDVLDAQRTYLQAKSQYVRALLDAYHAAAEIDRILGDDSLIEHFAAP